MRRRWCLEDETLPLIDCAAAITPPPPPRRQIRWLLFSAYVAAEALPRLRPPLRFTPLRPPSALAADRPLPPAPRKNIYIDDIIGCDADDDDARAMRAPRWFALDDAVYWLIEMEEGLYAPLRRCRASARSHAQPAACALRRKAPARARTAARQALCAHVNHAVVDERYAHADNAAHDAMPPAT